MKANKILFIILMISIALHLMFSNFTLLLDMQKLSGKGAEDTFGYVSKGVFALSYSIITAIILILYPRMWMICITAVLDGFAIYLKYNIDQENFILLSSVYFGTYTMFIIVVAGLIRIKQVQDTNIVDSKINLVERQDFFKYLELIQDYNGYKKSIYKTSEKIIEFETLIKSYERILEIPDKNRMFVLETKNEKI